MSASRRHQLRDHLGRFTSRRGRRALAWTLAALRSELARRIGRLVLVAAALAGVVVVLYQHGDTPAALARPATASTVPPARVAPAAPPAAAPRRQDVTPRPERQTAAVRPGPERGRAAAAQPPQPTRPAAVANLPADVASAWYAARAHLPASQVRALQQDVISRRKVRVLVLADRGRGRLDTALVTVRRDAAGRWSVP
jgi:hypothetical protein